MDDIVKAAMQKWPNVPHCYGWLGLDERGDWYMRDDRVQAAGSFLQAKGSRLTHDKLIAFIERNYACDAAGAYFFQNGPQRVYVELAATPYIWRLSAMTDGTIGVCAHTRASAKYQTCFQDARGYVYLTTDLGLGLVHTQDVSLAAQALELGQWHLSELSGGVEGQKKSEAAITASDLPKRFGFVKSPAKKY